jgi:hypothetical protein
MQSLQKTCWHNGRCGFLKIVKHIEQNKCFDISLGFVK